MYHYRVLPSFVSTHSPLATCRVLGRFIPTNNSINRITLALKGGCPLPTYIHTIPYLRFPLAAIDSMQICVHYYYTLSFLFFSLLFSYQEARRRVRRNEWSESE